MLGQVYDNVHYLSAGEERVLESKTVVPTIVIQELVLKPDYYYCRAGGYLYEYKGNRTFEKSVDFIYEKDGKPISFKPKKDEVLDVRLAEFGGNMICLV
jgi:CRISPR-associated protein Cas5h